MKVNCIFCDLFITTVVLLLSLPLHVVQFDEEIISNIQSYQQTLATLLPPAKGWAELHTFPLTDLHISLSRTVPIMFHWIEPLTNTLREKLRNMTRFIKVYNIFGNYRRRGRHYKYKWCRGLMLENAVVK